MLMMMIFNAQAKLRTYAYIHLHQREKLLLHVSIYMCGLYLSFADINNNMNDAFNDIK